MDNLLAISDTEKMELVIVDDEEKVARFLKSSLEAEGHVVHCCSDREELECLLSLGSLKADVIILDRMLKGVDGVSLIPLLKKRLPQVRVLVLSAIDVAEEKATALDFGADDYLAKPFSLSELSARLRALARRGASERSPAVVLVRDVMIDFRSQSAIVEGKRLDLTKKEYQVLLTLCENPGRVFNKYQLLDRVWDLQTDVESNTVEVTIRNLRRKLSEAKSKVEILSKRNVGYWIDS